MKNSRTLGRSNLFLKPGFYRIAMALTMAAAFGLWGCGSSTSSSAASPSSISVTVTPNSVTVLRDATQTFTAKVTGTTNTAVTWSVEGSGGTIDSAGLYTPPQNGAGTFYVVATSQANSAASGSAVVTVPMPQITISPVAATVHPGGTRTFAATVSGLTNTAVNFTVQESAGGLINSAGPIPRQPLPVSIKSSPPVPMKRRSARVLPSPSRPLPVDLRLPGISARRVACTQPP